MKLEVVKNAKRNIAFGAVNKVIVLLCPFIERTVIRYAFGADYLGLSSLFTSLLTVLSLSELGFSSAIVYNMYKPVAEGDMRTVNAYLNFYKKAYRVVGSVILVLGLLLIPLIPRLISGSCPADVNIIWLYLLYLGNAVISYFMFAYMSAVIVVNQRDDISSTVNSVIKLCLTAAQLAVVYLTRNYYLFLFLLPVFTVLSNLWTARTVKRRFPQYRCEGEIPREKYPEIRKLVAGTFIQKACAITRNSLDSICVSGFLGLTLTGIYNNYFQLSNSVKGLLGLVSAAFIGGVGNHIASRSAEENFSELRKIDFAYLGLSGWCAIFLLCLYQPFMKLWMGADMMLPMNSVFLFCLYFYLLSLGDMRYMYMSANGLFWKHRWRSIAETAANFILNIVLGKYFGINGIIFATVISLFLCNYIWANIITFREYFGTEKLKGFYLYQAKYSLVTLAACAASYGLCSCFAVQNQLLELLCRGCVCIVIPGSVYYLAYRRLPEFEYLKNKIISRQR